VVGWRCFADGTVEPVEVDDYWILHDAVINGLLEDITDMIHDINILHGDMICDRITDEIFDITELVEQPDLECIRFDDRAGSGGDS